MTITQSAAVTRPEPPPALSGDVSPAPGRSGFVDLARALAVLMMLQGHTLDAVLAAEVRTGTAFSVWSAVRGLTACLFLLLSGVAFTVATHRRWQDHLSSPPTIVRRFHRFALFLLIGYALHFPMGKIVHLYGMSEERWRSFLVVDVLQCTAVMLALLQGLVLASRTPRRFAVMAALGCAAIVALTPAMWRSDWTGGLPLALAAYLSPATGSLFPLFPWGAYILLGAWLGHVYVGYSREGTVDLARFANRILLGGGAAMLVVALVCVQVPLQPFGPTDFWYTSPNQFLLRSAVLLLVLGAAAHASRRIPALPYPLRALARESLTVYAVHLCVVYGSVWALGLRQRVGPTLPLPAALAYVAVVLAAMITLASAWHWCKHRQPGAAQWVWVGTAGLLLGTLL